MGLNACLERLVMMKIHTMQIIYQTYQLHERGFNILKMDESLMQNSGDYFQFCPIKR